MTGGRPSSPGAAMTWSDGVCGLTLPRSAPGSTARREAHRASACGNTPTGAHNGLVVEGNGIKGEKCREIPTLKRASGSVDLPSDRPTGPPAGTAVGLPRLGASGHAPTHGIGRPLTPPPSVSAEPVRRAAAVPEVAVPAAGPVTAAARTTPVEVGAADGADHRGRGGRCGARCRPRPLGRHVRHGVGRCVVPAGREQTGSDPFTESTAKDSSTTPVTPAANAPESANGHARCVGFHARALRRHPQHRELRCRETGQGAPGGAGEEQGVRLRGRRPAQRGPRLPALAHPRTAADGHPRHQPLGYRAARPPPTRRCSRRARRSSSTATGCRACAVPAGTR